MKIIKNTMKARKKYWLCYGYNNLILSEEDIQALIDGKCIAWDDLEYSTFISLKEPSE